ncbi:MAG: hypothetical protein AABW90_02720 [Nanoarchaeota archaeon]
MPLVKMENFIIGMENFLEDYVIQFKKSRGLNNKFKFSEIDIPDRYIKKFVDMCYCFYDKKEIEKEADNIAEYVLKKVKI